jgi:hypothetical protein
MTNVAECRARVKQRGEDWPLAISSREGVA